MGGKRLNQQAVTQLRDGDMIVVWQDGREKRMLATSILEYIRGQIALIVPTVAVGPHTHPESQIINLATDLNAINSALTNKAALNHGHVIADIPGLAAALAAIGTYVDVSSGTASNLAGCYPALVKATVSGGNAVFQLTTNGLAGGTAIFTNGAILNSPTFRAEEGTNPIATGAPIWSNSNKTLTVPVSRVGTAVSILGISVLGATVAANGTVVYATVWGR